jgi:UDP-glucose 4-epimerase
MIYGKGSKGNYPLLSKVAKKIPLFPSIKNERSMLYVNNLSEFVRLMIENEENGISFPQNSSFTQTRKMVQEIAHTNGKRICVTPIFNWMFYLIAYCPGKVGKTVNKVFGNLVYDQNLSKYCNNSYQSIDFAESIRLTEEM